MAINTIPAPKSVEETGVRRNLLEDLVLKILYMAGELTIQELARKMALGHRVVDDLFQRLRKEQLCQVTGVDRGVHYCLTTTSGGKSRALDLLAQNQYVGPAPVSVRTGDIDKIRTVLENKLIRQRLQDLGYSTDEITSRLVQMTDQEVHSIVQKLDDLRVGADKGS